MDSNVKEHLLTEVSRLRKRQDLLASELVSLRRQVVKNIVKVNNISYEHEVHDNRVGNRTAKHQD